MSPLQPTQPMYLQLANHIATAIRAGQEGYRPGDALPSESTLTDEHRVSRITVRHALRELEGMGLIDKVRGRNSVVRGAPSPVLAVDRSIQRSGKRWRLPGALPEQGTPAVTRTCLDGLPGRLLDQQDQDAFSVDRMVQDPDTGVRIAHRIFIPLATAAEVPSLAKAPDAPVEEILQQLSDAGYSLGFTEHVTARAPYPDERAALGLTDTSPLLITYRVVADTGQHRPLVCEEIRASAASCLLAVPVTPTRAAAKRAPRKPASE